MLYSTSVIFISTSDKLQKDHGLSLSLMHILPFTWIWINQKIVLLPVNVHLASLNVETVFRY